LSILARKRLNHKKILEKLTGEGSHSTVACGTSGGKLVRAKKKDPILHDVHFGKGNQAHEPGGGSKARKRQRETKGKKGKTPKKPKSQKRNSISLSGRRKLLERPHSRTKNK